MIKIYFKILKNRFKLLISFISFIIVSVFLLIPLLFGSNLYPFIKGFYNFKKQVLKYELMQLNMKKKISERCIVVYYKGIRKLNLVYEN